MAVDAFSGDPANAFLPGFLAAHNQRFAIPAAQADPVCQARAAGRQLLGTLRPEDRFRLIDFSSDVRTFRDDFAPATPAILLTPRTWTTFVVVATFGCATVLMIAP